MMYLIAVVAIICFGGYAMKKVALFLSCIMILTMLPVFSVSADEYPIPSVPTPISTYEEFEALSGVPGNYYLTGDIDFGGKVYEKCIVEKFDGILDGNGHKLYNFKINQTVNDSDAGIFLFIGNLTDTTIKNLNVGSEDIPISMTFYLNGKSSGALSATSGKTGSDRVILLDNVHLYVDMDILYQDISHKGNAAGFIGYARNKCELAFKGCSLNGTFDSGIDNEGMAYRNTAGFIASNNTSATFENCTNNADIVQGYSAVEARASGFVTYCAGGCDLVFNNCINNGDIKVIGELSDAYASGFASCPKGLVTMTACENNGDISGYWYSGGFLSQVLLAGYSITDCTNTGAISDTAICYSAACGFVPPGYEITVTNFKNTSSAPDVYVYVDPANTTAPEAVVTTAPEQETADVVTDVGDTDEEIVTTAPEQEDPEVDVTTEEKAPDTAAPSEKKGCGGMIAGGTVILSLIAVAFATKKRD